MLFCVSAFLAAKAGVTPAPGINAALISNVKENKQNIFTHPALVLFNILTSFMTRF
jgi:formate dehydrogenase assembly factor FdhD